MGPLSTQNTSRNRVNVSSYKSVSLSCILVPSLCLRGESSRQALSASLYKLVPRQQKQLNLFLPSVYSPLKTAPLTKPTGSIMGMNRMTASLYMTGTKALKKKLSKPMPHLLSRENLGCYCGDKTGNRLNERKKTEKLVY